MTPEERQEFYNDLIRIVRKLQRTYSRVYPWMIIPHLDIMRVEQTLRKDMVHLAQQGRLIRVGGYNARKGYIVPREGHPTATPTRRPRTLPPCPHRQGEYHHPV